MVGVTGIEPVTPTMSTRLPRRKRGVSLPSQTRQIQPQSTPNKPLLGQSLGSVETAAGWLCLNRKTVTGPVIPTLRSRFGLTILDAIEAAKLAHALEYPGEGR